MKFQDMIFPYFLEGQGMRSQENGSSDAQLNISYENIIINMTHIGIDKPSTTVLLINMANNRNMYIRVCVCVCVCVCARH